MIFASPSATAVTTPLGSTVATPGLELTQVMGTLPPLSNATEAVRVSLLPTVLKSRSFLFSVTRPMSEVTVTVHRTACPLEASAVMVAPPVPCAVTRPFSSTVATSGLELSHW